MKKQHKKESLILEHEFDRLPKEIVEKKFILDFFQKLPIEDLKRLINYKVTDFRDKSLWGVSFESDQNLNRLRYERAILIESNIFLDDGIDDYSILNELKG